MKLDVQVGLGLGQTVLDGDPAPPKGYSPSIFGPCPLWHWPTSLTLLIKMPATVTVYRGHRRTLYYLPGITSMIITCIGIIMK